MVNRSMAENADIGPTIVELAGGELPHQQFAKSLVGALDGVTEHRADGLSEFRGEMMLMTPSHKAALNRDGKVYLLFDLETDPYETNNLAGLSEYRVLEDELRLEILERVARSQLKAP